MVLLLLLEDMADIVEFSTCPVTVLEIEFMPRSVMYCMGPASAYKPMGQRLQVGTDNSAPLMRIDIYKYCDGGSDYSTRFDSDGNSSISFKFLKKSK